MTDFVGNDNHCDKSKTTDTDDDAEDWDSIYDDNGDVKKPELVKEFKNAVNIQDRRPVQVVQSQDDFKDFTNEPLSSASNQKSFIDLTDHEYPHVLEVYDLVHELTTQDLITTIMTAGSSEFAIVWVDHTHALAVFRSEAAANIALQTVFPGLKVRVLSQAFPESRLKARQSTDRLLPPKTRPQTSVSLARRLVGRHLGLKVEVSAEQLQEERRVLQEVKEKRQQAKKQSDDIWEGKVD